MRCGRWTPPLGRPEPSSTAQRSSAPQSVRPPVPRCPDPPDRLDLNLHVNRHEDLLTCSRDLWPSCRGNPPVEHPLDLRDLVHLVQFVERGAERELVRRRVAWVAHCRLAPPV